MLRTAWVQLPLLKCMRRLLLLSRPPLPTPRIHSVWPLGLLLQPAAGDGAVLLNRLQMPRQALRPCPKKPLLLHSNPLPSLLLLLPPPLLPSSLMRCLWLKQVKIRSPISLQYAALRLLRAQRFCLKRRFPPLPPGRS